MILVQQGQDCFRAAGIQVLSSSPLYSRTRLLTTLLTQVMLTNATTALEYFPRADKELLPSQKA